MSMNGIYKCKDITGVRSGKLVAISYYGRNKFNQPLWLCKCDCGNTKVVRASDITGGHIKSCGCIIKKDLTGMKFGRLTVIELLDDKSHKYRVWRCKCDCGNIINVRTNYLLSGHTKSCGCLKENILDGKRFGRLTVICEHHRTNDRGKYYLCKCDCGTYIVARSDCLIDGTVKSCGCISRKPNVNLAGQKFGKLSVIEYIGDSYWHCRCECGKHINVTTTQLLHDNKASCGCDSSSIIVCGSIMENVIKSYIHKEFPQYSLEKTRKILDGKEIDIYIPELKIGIEYNGSAFHASKNGVYSNKDKYYHRDKFLLAREKGVKLITIFDKYFEDYDKLQLNIIKDVIKGVNPFIPLNEIEYTDNNYDYGLWMQNYGYKEIGQTEPSSFIYDCGNKNFLVYDCGKTIWKRA